MELVQLPEEEGEELIAALDDKPGNNMPDMAKTLSLKKGSAMCKGPGPREWRSFIVFSTN